MKYCPVCKKDMDQPCLHHTLDEINAAIKEKTYKGKAPQEPVTPTGEGE